MLSLQTVVTKLEP